MLKYEIVVEGLLVAGHPFSELSLIQESAFNRFDELSKKYPRNNVKLYELTKTQIKESGGKMPNPTECPKGHKGSMDGQSIMRQGLNGKWNCGVCGEQWEAK